MDNESAVRRRSHVLFREEQRFNQFWLWALLVGMSLIEFSIFGLGIYQQIVREKPWGTNPMSDVALILTAMAVFLFTGGLLAFFLAMKLITEVRADGLYVRFFPMHFSFKRMELEKVTKVEALTYRPIGQYGGWGIRCSWNFKGKAYNTSGNRGVRLDYANGKHLLIGSQRAEELAKAIESIRASKA